MTTLQNATTRVPVVPVVAAAVAAQFVDDLAYVVLPPVAIIAPVSAFLAVLLTAVGARLATRKLSGPSVARTGLAVGAVSAGIGLLVGGFGWLGMILATLTLVAGVAGAVVGRRNETVTD
ncbi:hypothetical protein [Pseudonocardia sp.]|uniref:hypothetical protein n=1 Tax=Pseudonocardia sp. TaxID=60912 RepID=UPI003D107668